MLFRLQGFPDAFLVIDRLVLSRARSACTRGCGTSTSEPTSSGMRSTRRRERESVSVNRPQLAKTRRDDAQCIGLVMKGGYGEVFNTAPQLVDDGRLRRRSSGLAPGRSELVFRSVPPSTSCSTASALAAELPVHVQLQRLESDGLPDALESYDGMSQRIAGWYAITRHGTGRLDGFDTARAGDGRRPAQGGGPGRSAQAQPAGRRDGRGGRDAGAWRRAAADRCALRHRGAAAGHRGARAALEAAPGGGK